MLSQHFQGLSFTDFYQSLKFRKCNSTNTQCPIYARASCFNYQELILDRIKYTDKIEAKNVQISGCSFFQAENGCENYSDDTKDTKACRFSCQERIFNMAKFDHIVCRIASKSSTYSLFIL